MQDKALFYFHFDIFIFENKVAGGGGGGGGGEMQLDGQLWNALLDIKLFVIRCFQIYAIIYIN